MLCIKKGASLYFFILLIVCCVQNSYANNISQKVDSTIEQAFEYNTNKFSPFDVVNLYFSASPFAKEYRYLNIGIEKNIHTYVNYALDFSMIMHKKTKEEFLDTNSDMKIFKFLFTPKVFDSSLAIKFKIPFQFQNYYFAPYAAFMVGLSFKSTDFHRSIAPLSFIVREEPDPNAKGQESLWLKIGLVKTMKLGVDFYPNEWLGMFFELQTRIYDFPSRSGTNPIMTHVHYSDPKVNIEIRNLFVIGLKITF